MLLFGNVRDGYLFGKVFVSLQYNMYTVITPEIVDIWFNTYM